jgi:hypothetical protein
MTSQNNHPSLDKKKHRAIPSRTPQQTVELQHTGEAHSVVTNLSGTMKSW